MALLLKKVERPRELKWYQAGAMLYGDWGTSKAYVLGLAFAIAGHASMFFIVSMSVLVALVGYCYTIVCKAYPDGGGVYSSLRNRSRTAAVIGALLLVADYVVTAALSALAAFYYLGWPAPQIWAITSLAIIGALNVFGPKHSSKAATLIAVVVAILLAILCIATLPHLGEVRISVPEGSFFSNWGKFVGLVLALSGVEAIANVTGIMVEPVKRTAKRAILPVLFEVIVVSLILGAAMNAIPGLEGRTEDMIRAIADHYIGPSFGAVIGICLSLLLLSAANTAIMGLISILFLMSKDKELPPVFADLNRFGMPWFGLFLAAATPILVLLLQHSIEQLAALYAIGVVGAITMNLGACSMNDRISIKHSERVILVAVAIVMFFVELTIMVEKHNAVIFAFSVLAVGLIARSAHQFAEARRVVVPAVLGINVLTLEEARDLMPLYKGSTLVALKGVNASLLDEAAVHAKGKGDKAVYALVIEEKPPGWAYPTEVEPSIESVKTLTEVSRLLEEKGLTCVPLWNLGDDPGLIIVKTARDLELDTVMIGATRRGALERMLRGEVLKTITEQLPQEKHLLICN